MLKATMHSKDESGAVAIMVALLLVVFVGFTALAVDVGYLYSVKRQLQAAADAAALAGCQELIKGVSESGVLDEARLYAEGDETKSYNNVAPGDGLTMIPAGVNNPNTGNPYTEVTESYVKVAVKKDTTLFFGRIFDALGYKTIMAQSKAKVVYLTGLKNIAPWGVPIVQASRVTAQVGGNPEVELSYNSGTSKWEGQLPVGMFASTNGYNVTVTAYNNQTEYPDGTSEYPNGVPETLHPASNIVVQQAGARIQNVYLSKYYATIGQDSTFTLYVESTETPKASFTNNNNISLSPVSGSPNLYSVTLSVPATTGLKETYPIDVSVGSGNDKYEIRSAAILVARRATYPIKEVSLGQAFFTQGAAGLASISVELNDYEYGQSYPLKVIGGEGEVGNFCALDLATIKHPPNWRHPQHPSEYDITTDPNYSPPAYYNYLAEYFPFVIHLGDTIWTQTGTLSAPQTMSALDTRFDGDNRTFSQWVADGKPNTKRVIFVPIVEKMQVTTGSSPMRVVSFAAFYVEPTSGSSGSNVNIIGRFIEYVAPSEAISETPPDSNYYLQTPHLVSAGLDF